MPPVPPHRARPWGGTRTGAGAAGRAPPTPILPPSVPWWVPVLLHCRTQGHDFRGSHRTSVLPCLCNHLTFLTLKEEERGGGGEEGKGEEGKGKGSQKANKTLIIQSQRPWTRLGWERRRVCEGRPGLLAARSSAVIQPADGFVVCPQWWDSERLLQNKAVVWRSHSRGQGWGLDTGNRRRSPWSVGWGPPGGQSPWSPRRPNAEGSHGHTQGEKGPVSPCWGGWGVPEDASALLTTRQDPGGPQPCPPAVSSRPRALAPAPWLTPRPACPPSPPSI